MPRAIQLLVLHCTASPNGDSLFRKEDGLIVTPVEIVDRWHRERGFHRKPEDRARLNADLASIGYHWLIYTNGVRASGRSANEMGAHALRHNYASIGVAMVGTSKFTQAQWNALEEVVRALCDQYRIPLTPINTGDPRGMRGVCGHNELPDVAKACPGFSVRDWINRGLKPLPSQIQPD